MTPSDTNGTVTTHEPVSPLGVNRLRRVVAVLCFTEIVSWGVLFYAFPVMVATISETEGWPLTNLMAAFTLAQVVAAVAGVWVGRHIDQHGPHRVMTTGSVLAVTAVVALSQARTQPAFFGAFALVGLSMSATLYAPAFTALTHWAGQDRRVHSLTAVTLIAGLASTVFAPLTAVLMSFSSWRGTYLALAAVLATTAVAHAWGLRDPWVTGQPADHSNRRPSEHGAYVAAATPPARLWSDPTYLGLVAAFTLAGFSAYAVVVNLVPMLTSRGLSTSEAALALGVGGIGQVAGRLAYSALTRFNVRARTMLVVVGISVTTAALAIATDSLLAVAIAATAAGFVRGLFTLLQATAVPDRWGTRSYGARTAALTGSVMAASAFAPWLGALLATTAIGWTGAFVILAALAAATLLLIRPTRP